MKPQEKDTGFHRNRLKDHKQRYKEYLEKMPTQGWRNNLKNINLQDIGDTIQYNRKTIERRGKKYLDNL